MSERGRNYGTKTNVQQQFKNRTSVSSILDRFRRGETPASAGVPRFLDIYDAPSYQDAHNRIIEVNQNFFGLPAKVRQRFQNNPVNLLGFLQDPSNKKEAQELGLIKKPSEELKTIKKEPKTPVEPVPQGEKDPQGTEE